MASINDLDEYCLQKLFSHFTAKEAARNMLVDRSWNTALKDEVLWRKLGQQDWDLVAPCTLKGEPLESYRFAYADWQKELGTYSGPDRLPQRSAKLWRDLRGWFAEHIPQIAASLNPGCSEAELNLIEEWSALKLPPALRITYRFCNGQDERKLQAPRLRDYRHWHHYGLFGGTHFYHEMMGVSFMDLETVQSWAGIDVDPWTKPSTEHFASLGFPFALVGSGAEGCAYLIQPGTGQVVLSSAPFISHVPLSPEGCGMLEWLEIFAHRVTSGGFQPATLQSPDGSLATREAQSKNRRYLSKFPKTAEAGMREAVTQGIRIRVGPAVVPQSCVSHGVPTRQFLFAYSVSFYLLPVEEQQQSWPASSGPFRPRTRVQLTGRCWNIRRLTGEAVDVVAGPGVIGLHPVLTAGGPEFSYESCSPSSSCEPSSMSGHFTFVEGLMSRPEGPCFDVQ